MCPTKSFQHHWHKTRLIAFIVRNDKPCCQLQRRAVQCGDTKHYWRSISGLTRLMYAASFTAGSHADKFRLSRPSIWLALQVMPVKWRFHRRSLLMVTPRYFVCMTESRAVSCKKYKWWDFGFFFFSWNVHNFTPRCLKSHIPSLGPVSKMLNIFL